MHDVGDPLGSGDLGPQVPQNGLLISYFVGVQGLYAITQDADGKLQNRHIPCTSEMLAGAVEDFRGAIENQDPGIPAAAKLHEILIGDALESHPANRIMLQSLNYWDD